MVQIPNIPKIPPKEELEYKEKQFMTSLYEQFQQSDKRWLWGLLAAVALAIPVALLFKALLANYFIPRVKVPQALTDQYPDAKPLEVTKSGILAVEPGVYSVYVQVLNPNPEIGARDFKIGAELKDKNQKMLQRLSSSAILPPNISRFVVFPSVKLAGLPQTLDAFISEVQWSRYAPDIKPNFEILKKTSGITLEGNFFVEGTLRNPDGFIVKKTSLSIVVFDKTNTKVAAVNATVLADIQPYENRYFRVTWPAKMENIGEIEITADVNLFESNIALPETEPVPSR